MKDSLRLKIGQRIAQERKACGLTQSVFSERIGITKSRLASYEDGRGCLRCGIAFAICRNLIISEQWLATGEGEKDHFGDVESYLSEDLLPRPFEELIKLIVETFKNDCRVDSFLNLLRYNDVHPETFRLACIKDATKFAGRIEDDLSKSHFWLNLLEHAFKLGSYYSTSPRQRDLSREVTILKAGNEIPFSYEVLFDDLSLVGLKWITIENIAGVINARYRELGKPVSSTDLKNIIYKAIIDFVGKGKSSDLYKKIYLERK